MSWDDEGDDDIVDADMRWTARAAIGTEPMTPTSAQVVAAAPRKQWVNPYEALLDEVTRTNAFVIILGQQVEEWDSQYGGAHKHRAARSTLARFERERDRLIAVCSKAISLGIAERHVRIAEKQGELVVSQLIRSLDTAGVQGEQRRAVLNEFAAGLRALGRPTVINSTAN